MDITYSYQVSIDMLRANKQYSPLYDTTFDLMTDEQCKIQLDLWFENGTIKDIENIKNTPKTKEEAKADFRKFIER